MMVSRISVGMAPAAASQLDSRFFTSSRYYPLELRHIKALFIQGQYQQCIRACRDVLVQMQNDPAARPLQDTFVLFYTAMCHEEIARAGQQQQQQRHQQTQQTEPASAKDLQCAETFYLEALESLPLDDEAEALYAAVGGTGSQELVLDSRPDTAFSTREGVVVAHRRNKSAITPTLLSPVIRNDSPLDHSSSSHSLTLTIGPRDGEGEDDGAEFGDAEDNNGLEDDADDLESHSSFRQIRSPGTSSRLQQTPSQINLPAPIATTSPSPPTDSEPKYSHSPPPPPRSPSRLLVPPIPAMSNRRKSLKPPALKLSPKSSRSSGLLAVHTQTQPETQISKNQYDDVNWDEPEEPVSPIDPEEDFLWNRSSRVISPISPEFFHHAHNEVGAGEVSDLELEFTPENSPKMFEGEWASNFGRGEADGAAVRAQTEVGLGGAEIKRGEYEDEDEEDETFYDLPPLSPDQQLPQQQGLQQSKHTATPSIASSVLTSTTATMSPSFPEKVDAMRARIHEHLDIVRDLKSGIPATPSPQQGTEGAADTTAAVDDKIPQDETTQEPQRSFIPTMLPLPSALPLSTAQSWAAKSTLPMKETTRPVMETSRMFDHREKAMTREMAKVLERHARIQEGRARKWQRKRFDPLRYRVLCEIAVAEL